jgi:hypothetical protein
MLSRGCATVVDMGSMHIPERYQPMSVAQLAALMVGADEDLRWRLLAEFLEEYRWESAGTRHDLLVAEPGDVGDRRWDVLLAALAEHLAARDGRGAPSWSEGRALTQFWFPFNTPSARTDAIVHAPAAFRRRGVFVAAHELDVA